MIIHNPTNLHLMLVIHMAVRRILHLLPHRGDRRINSGVRARRIDIDIVRLRRAGRVKAVGRRREARVIRRRRERLDELRAAMIREESVDHLLIAILRYGEHVAHKYG